MRIEDNYGPAVHFENAVNADVQRDLLNSVRHGTQNGFDSNVLIVNAFIFCSNVIMLPSTSSDMIELTGGQPRRYVMAPTGNPCGEIEHFIHQQSTFCSE